MSTELDRLGQVLASAEVEAFLASEERLTHASLASLADMINSVQDVKLVRGERFHYDPQAKVLTYDAALLVSLPPAAAPGLIWHNIGHVQYSQPRRESVKSTVKDIHTKTKGEIPEPSIMQILEAMEDERMEPHVREGWANLCNTYLPRVDQGWRADGYQQDKEVLDTLTEPGLTDEQGTPIYWERVATAVRGLVSGAMDATDLPEDITITEDLVQEIQGLRALPTVDDLLQQSKEIVPRLVRQQFEPPPQPQSGQESGEGEGGGQGANRQPGQEQGNPAKYQSWLKRQRAAYDPRANTFVVNGDPRQIDGFVNNGTAAGFEPGVIDRSYVGPPWNVVLKTVALMVGQIRAQTRKHLKDNEVEEHETGQRYGKLNRQALVPFVVTQNIRVFKRPQYNAQKSYAVAFVVDRSGSMGMGYPGGTEITEIEPWIMGNTRMALAIRVCVALVNDLERFKEVKTSVAYFEGRCEVIKSFTDRLDAAKKQEIMNTLHANGGTVIRSILTQMPHEFAKVRADKKLCIILSDGDLGVRGQEQELLAKARAQHGIEFAVLCVGCEPDQAKAMFGDKYADKITEQTVGKVLGEHLRRMVRGR